MTHTDPKQDRAGAARSLYAQPERSCTGKHPLDDLLALLHSEPLDVQDYILATTKHLEPECAE